MPTTHLIYRDSSIIISTALCYNHAHMAQRSSRSFLQGKATVITVFLVTGICLLSCLPVAVLGSLYEYYQANHLIYPGVAVGQISLQGKTLQQASVELHKDWNLERRIQVVDGLHTWTLAPADLGLSLDALQTARQAYEVGRGYLLPGNLGQMVYSMRNGWQVSPLLLNDLQQASKTLDQLNQQARLPAQDPSISFTGDQVLITPGKLGYELNIEEALKTLEADPTGVMLNGTLRIPLRPLAPASIDYTAASQQAQALLDRPLTLQGYDPVSDDHFQWPVPRETVATWLALRQTGTGQEIGIAPQQVSGYLTSLNTELGPERYIDEAQADRAGNPGISIRRAHHAPHPAPPHPIRHPAR